MSCTDFMLINNNETYCNCKITFFLGFDSNFCILINRNVFQLHLLYYLFRYIFYRYSILPKSSIEKQPMTEESVSQRHT